MSTRQLSLTKSLRCLINKIYRYPVLITFGASVVLMVGCASVISVTENISFFEALFTRILACFLGELGEIQGGLLARIATVIGLTAGVIFITIVGAKVVTVFVDHAMRGGRVMKKVNHKNHIIICGWNLQGKNIIKQLLAPDIKERRQIVILANLEKKPINEDKVDFICGDPTKREDLKRAGIMTANTAIILTDMSSDSHGNINPDAQAVLMTLAVETARPDVYTCVQLMNSEYREHLEHVDVDEYISFDHMGSNLMVASALNHGLSWIINELLTFDMGSEFYKVKAPKAFVGKEFRKAANALNDKRVTLIAVETDEAKLDSKWKADLRKLGMLKEGKGWIVNPQKDYNLQKGDELFIIAQEELTEAQMNTMKFAAL